MHRGGQDVETGSCLRTCETGGVEKEKLVGIWGGNLAGVMLAADCYPPQMYSNSKHATWRRFPLAGPANTTYTPPLSLSLTHTHTHTLWKRGKCILFHVRQLFTVSWSIWKRSQKSNFPKQLSEATSGSSAGFKLDLLHFLDQEKSSWLAGRVKGLVFSSNVCFHGKNL